MSYLSLSLLGSSSIVRLSKIIIIIIITPYPYTEKYKERERNIGSMKSKEFNIDGLFKYWGHPTGDPTIYRMTLNTVLEWIKETHGCDYGTLKKWCWLVSTSPGVMVVPIHAKQRTPSTWPRWASIQMKTTVEG